MFLIPTAAAAEDGEEDDGLLLRIGGDVTVAKGETVDAVIVVDGNANIEGTVTGTVLVVSGDAIITGEVREVLTVISGNIDLRDGASVKDVNSVRGDIVRASGAMVTGNVEESEGIAWAGLGGVLAVFSFLFWIAMTFSVIVAGVLFAAVGGRQLTEAARSMTDAVASVVGFVFVWIAIPVLAAVAMATLIGLPLGFGVLVFLLPALWFLGYIVAGARLGGFIVGLAGRENGGAHPFAATALGLLILQLLVLVPVVGAIVALFAGAWGAGALAVTAYRGAGGKGFGIGNTPAAPLPTTPQTA
jgi:hypothetical protein